MWWSAGVRGACRGIGVRPVVALMVLGAFASLTWAGFAPPAGAAPRAKVTVVAGFYPLAWAAEAVGGRRVLVRNLTPAGTEPHDLELTTDQRDDIEDADVVLVLGDGFQPAVEDAAGARRSGTVELLRGLPRDRDQARLDPHVWLDPALMASIVVRTADALSRADPAGAATYAANAAKVTADLEALGARYRAGLADCERDLVVSAHAAFGYLTAAYGLRQLGVAGVAPDAEPNPRRLAELADLVEREGVTTIFTEELVSPRVARTLAREAGGLRTATLNPLEGLTAKEIAKGDDYLSVMGTNLSRLRRALGCR